MDRRASYRQNGYSLFRDALPVRALADASRETVEPYPGPLPRHDGTNRTRAEVQAGSLPFSTHYGLVNAHSWEIPAVQSFVDAFRDMLFSPAIYDALHALDGETHYTLHQSIFFFESPLTGPHIEAVSLDTLPHGHSFTVWGAVDPVTPLNGPPYVVQRPVGQYDPDPAERTIPALYRTTFDNLQARGELLTTLILNPGDFAVWASSTPHGSMPAFYDAPGRRSFQALYRPTRYDFWGSYPVENHGHHSIEHEEIFVNEQFNMLR